MKLGVAYCPFTDLSEYAPYPYMGDIEIAFEKAAEHGFSGIEVAIRTPKDIDVKKMEKCIQKFGVAMSAVATGQNGTRDGLTFTDPDTSVQKEAVKRIIEDIDFAAEHNAFVIIGGIRGNHKDKKEVLEARTTSCMSQIAEYAGKRNVTVLIEPINRYEISFGKSIDDIRDYVKKLNYDNVKILCDTYHMNIEDTSFYDPVIRAKDDLKYVHLCDSNRMAAGMGNIDYTDLFRALKQIEYDGYMVAEVLPLPTPEDVLITTKKTFNKYI
ncbi:MAG: TIM barrel protein [Christensenellales bacterium]